MFSRLSKSIVTDIYRARRTVSRIIGQTDHMERVHVRRCEATSQPFHYIFIYIYINVTLNQWYCLKRRNDGAWGEPDWVFLVYNTFYIQRPVDPWYVSTLVIRHWNWFFSYFTLPNLTLGDRWPWHWHYSPKAFKGSLLVLLDTVSSNTFSIPYNLSHYSNHFFIIL